MRSSPALPRPACHAGTTARLWLCSGNRAEGVLVKERQPALGMSMPSLPASCPALQAGAG